MCEVMVWVLVVRIVDRILISFKRTSSYRSNSIRLYPLCGRYVYCIKHSCNCSVEAVTMQYSENGPIDLGS
jgi:hypothetical protein